MKYSDKDFKKDKEEILWLSYGSGYCRLYKIRRTDWQNAKCSWNSKRRKFIFNFLLNSKQPFYKSLPTVAEIMKSIVILN